MTLPPVPLKAKAVAVLGACALSFVIGHGTRKTIEVEKIRTITAQAQTEIVQAQTKALKAERDALDAKTHWRTKTVYLPGGTVEVTKEVVKEVERHHDEQAAQVVTKTVVQDRVVYRDVKTEKVVAAPLPRWSVGARAGLNLDGRLQYGGEVGRRLIGGLWVTAGADVPNRAALVGLRVEF